MKQKHYLSYLVSVKKKKQQKKPHIGTIIYVLREHPKSHTHSPILIDQVQSWISNNLMYEI